MGLANTSVVLYPAICPRCDTDWRRRDFISSPIRTHRTGFQKIAQVLSDTLMRDLARPSALARKNPRQPIAFDAASHAVDAQPALILLRAFLSGVKMCPPQLRLAYDADRSRIPGSLWMPVAHLRPKLPSAQTPAPGVFHLNRHDLAPRVIHLDRHAPEQALAPWVFHLNYHASEHALAPRVFRLNRCDPAPRIFHLNHHAIRQILAPDHFASGLNSVWRNLLAADCPILTEEADFVRLGK